MTKHNLLSQTTAVQSILFISMGGIGNLVLLTPAIQMLTHRFPGCPVHFLLSRNGARRVVEHMPGIGQIIEIEPGSRNSVLILRKVRSLNPSVVIAATGTNPFKCGVIGLASGARIRLGESFGAGRLLYTHTIPWQPNRHELDANRAIAQLIASQSGQFSPHIWLSAHDREAASRFILNNRLADRTIIGMHIGAGPAMQYKRWSKANFAELALRVVNTMNASVLFFGGPDEQSTTASLVSNIGHDVLTCAGKLSVPASYELMKSCRVFVSNDSGPMHMAAAANVPVIGLFGPTSEQRTGPWGEGHAVLRSFCDKGPCYRNNRSISCKDWRCMAGIPVQRVEEKVRELAGLSQEG